MPMRKVSIADFAGCLFTICPFNAPIRRKAAAVRRIEIRNLYMFKNCDRGAITKDSKGIKPIIIKEMKVTRAVFFGFFISLWLCLCCERISFSELVDK